MTKINIVNDLSCICGDENNCDYYTECDALGCGMSHCKFEAGERCTNDDAIVVYKKLKNNNEYITDWLNDNNEKILERIERKIKKYEEEHPDEIVTIKIELRYRKEVLDFISRLEDAYKKTKNISTELG